MIIAYTGVLGGGKTLRAVMDAWQYSLAAGGAPVWANISLTDDGWEPHQLRNHRHKLGRITGQDDIVRFVAEGGGILILDEIHQDLDARQSLGAQNILLSRFMMFLRKSGITCLYTTQDEAQIDKRMRAVTNVLTWCESWGPRDSRTYRYTRLHYRTGQQLRTEMMTSDQASRFYQLYNTFEFTRQLEFPSTKSDFERFMIGLEEASEFARSYRGDPHRAWETFLSQSGYTPKKTAGRSQRVPSRSRVRTRQGRPTDGGGDSGTVNSPELASAAPDGGIAENRA